MDGMSQLAHDSETNYPWEHYFTVPPKDHIRGRVLDVGSFVGGRTVAWVEPRAGSRGGRGRIVMRRRAAGGGSTAARIVAGPGFWVGQGGVSRRNECFPLALKT